MRAACLDVGSNAIRYLVAERVGELLTEVEIGGVLTGLGQGIEQTGRLSVEAMQQSLDVISQFARRAKELGAEQIFALATSAVREAANGTEFVERVQAEASIPVHVLTSRQEAELTFIGATSGLSLQGRIAVFDVGGGTTEFITADGRTILSVHSLPLGSRRLTERFLRSDPIADDEFRSLQAHIEKALQPIKPLFSGCDTLVGTGGTVAILVMLAKGLKKFESREVHGFPFTKSQLDALTQRLRRLPLKGRDRLEGMEEGRAEVIVAGACLIQKVLDVAGADAFVASARSLMHGALLRFRLPS